MPEATLQYICTTWWFLSLSDDHHITGCVMLWIYTVQCSGNMADSTLRILLFPRGRSSNWWKQELLGNTHTYNFLCRLFVNLKLLYYVCVLCCMFQRLGWSTTLHPHSSQETWVPSTSYQQLLCPGERKMVQHCMIS